MRSIAPVITLVLCTAVHAAHAHIGPAAVKAVVAMEGGQPSILHLNEGLAVRRDEGWHYVCPALWGDVDMRDVDSVPGGPVLIGAETGVWTFAADGTAAAHPDPVASGGIPLATAASRDHVMQLRLDGDLTRLLRVSSEQAEVVWSDVTFWDTMGVGDDFVELLSMSTGQIQTLRIGTDGTELSRASAVGPASSLSGNVRIVDGAVYIVLKRLLDGAGWGVEAGQIEDGSWRVLHVGVSFAGPALGGQGELLVAVDGQLSVLDGDSMRALPLETVVNCVDAFEGFVYACDSIGLREITDAGPGPALFELLQLQPPEPQLVPDDKRALCDQQWRFYQQDLAWIGTTVAGADGGVPDGAVTDAGVPPVDASAAPSDGESPSAAPTSDAGGGCQLHRSRGLPPAAPILLFIALLVLRVASRKRQLR